MIPGKIYPIKITKNRILVIDEEGEAAFYPKEFFMTLALPAEVSEKLQNLDKIKIAA